MHGVQLDGSAKSSVSPEEAIYMLLDFCRSSSLNCMQPGGQQDRKDYITRDRPNENSIKKQDERTNQANTKMRKNDVNDT